MSELDLALLAGAAAAPLAVLALFLRHVAAQLKRQE
jgi:hypothetical protein